MQTIDENEAIYDNVHGFVKITKDEKKIINSIYFQRLREIKQLSFSYYVFPGAVHTRFSHSIGVLSVMTKILERLKETNPEYIRASEEKKLRMAALLHDIGHYPYSHMIEHVYKDDVIRLQVEHDDDIQDISGETNVKKASAKTDEILKTEGHHEKLGAYIIQHTNFTGGITQILREGHFSKNEIRDIALIIQGKSPTTWYNQVIHSDLDADRIDYLLRDGTATGAKYGTFDFDYLIKHCRLVPKDQGEGYYFAIQSSAVFTIEHFLLARYFWYAQIVYERTTLIFDRMGRDFFSWLIQNGLAYNYIDVVKCVSDPYKFFKFNDNYLWEKVFEIIDKKDEKSYNSLPKFNEYYELAKMLLERKPLTRKEIPVVKTLKYSELFCTAEEVCANDRSCKNFERCPKAFEEKFHSVVDQVKKECDKSREELVWVKEEFNKCNIFKLPGTRDKEEVERDLIHILEKNGKTTTLMDQPHSIIPLLGKYELLIPRIYTNL
ncbi:MAG: HD domain-containing protein [Veillonellales bacterium]